MPAVRITCLAFCLCALPGPAKAAESEVKGVNPADILSRADLIGKVVNLPDGESLSTIGKYDRKLGPGLGGAIEFPFASYVNVGTADAFGVGDIFVRLRYVHSLTPTFIALGSVEAVVPTASDDLLGAGKWQLNPGVGFVKVWSVRSFTAAIYKHSFSVAGDGNRTEIDVNQVRALQTFILDRGYYVTLDGKHEWTVKGSNQDWTTAEFEVGRQFSPRFAGSLRLGKAFGDRANDGTLELNVRTFF